VAPVPLAGLPPIAVHVNVTGAIPPVEEALHETTVPTVPVLGQLIVTISVGTVIVTVVEAVFV
jgi:hypothetical protein